VGPNPHPTDDSVAERDRQSTNLNIEGLIFPEFSNVQIGQCSIAEVVRRLPLTYGEEVTEMLWTLIVLLLLFWVLGFAFHVAGGIIHVLLVIALVLFLVNLISGRRTVV
jgi:hypothetical protein